VVKGYSIPLSPLGQANLAGDPPWRYSSEILAAEFWVNRQAADEKKSEKSRIYALSSGMIWPISIAWLAGASWIATSICSSVAPVAL
jgi:hypothetical protein